MRRDRIYISAFLLVLGLLVYLETEQKQPVNWNPSYAATDKIPLGTYILYQELENAYPIESIELPPYEFLQNFQGAATYLFINNQLPFDDAELKSLLKWVEQGNTAFLASEFLGENLLDTLGMTMEVVVPRSDISSRPVFNLKDLPAHGDKPYLFDRETFYYTFSSLDSMEHEILGTVRSLSDSTSITETHPNFIRIPFGSGQILLHAAPQIFSNFFLLHENNHTYTESALSYIFPNSPILWDAYHKSGKVFQTSPLYILFETPSLKWAYYVVLLGSLLFIFFEGKRKQRSIPVIDLPQNHSIQFAATLADLYLEQQDYKSIAIKSISFFFRFLQMKTDNTKDTDIIKKVSARWDIPKSEINSLLEYMNDLQKKEHISERELKDLHGKINNFKNRINGKYTT